MSDLSSMRQGNTAGSTAAAVGSAVGYLADKSGNGNHATQATAGFRPILRQSGALYYLEFDGVDDYLQASFTIAQPYDRVSALRQLTWPGGKRVFGGLVASTGLLFQSTGTPSLALADGVAAAVNSGATLNTDVVALERHNGASSSLQFGSNTATTGNPGAGAPNGITLGADFNGSSSANVWIYGVCMIGRALTTDETTSLRTYMGAKAGLSL